MQLGNYSLWNKAHNISKNLRIFAVFTVIFYVKMMF
jgi:hypothetical protein